VVGHALTAVPLSSAWHFTASPPAVSGAPFMKT
jgi:hypothetical protein